MEVLSAPLRGHAERAARIGRVKFVALVLDDEAVVPHEPDEPWTAAARSSFQRLLQFLRRFASRVDGRPMAARP